MTWAIIACSVAAASASTGERAIEPHTEPAQTVGAEAEPSLWPARSAQALGGVLIGVPAAVGIGLVGIYVVCGRFWCNPEVNFTQGMNGLFTGLAIGGSLGAAVGVHMFGKLFGRDASFWTVLAGSALGSLAAIPTLVVGAGLLSDAPAAGTALIIVAAAVPTAAAMIAFEFSSDAIRRKSAAPTVAAFVVPIRGGAALSLSGGF